jgi:hypothetical protein
MNPSLGTRNAQCRRVCLCLLKPGHGNRHTKCSLSIQSSDALYHQEWRDNYSHCDRAVDVSSIVLNQTSHGICSIRATGEAITHSESLRLCLPDWNSRYLKQDYEQQSGLCAS